MPFWKPLRIVLLATTALSAVGVLGHTILGKTSEPRQVKTVSLPSTVPLPEWKFSSSQPMVDPIGKTYDYRQSDRKLHIEVRYVDRPGPNETLFRQYDPNRVSPGMPATELRQHSETGFYSLSVYEEQAYLRSCINPRGGSAITYNQFIRNRYTSDLNPSRLLSWLLSQEPLRDHRCLWNHLSISIKGTSPEQAYAILETVWSAWYKWWQANFPKL